jgi:predicted DNA-binding transcriptional regulator YafY
MSKHETLLRHQKIISKLRNSKSATFEEIVDYLRNQSELLEYNLVISQRTFQRDIIEMRSLYDLDIQFDRARKVYYIDDDNSELNSRLMEAFDMVSALKMAEGLNQFISFEKRKPQGTHHFYGLLHAIRNRFVLNLTHQKFEDDEPKTRLVMPYGLKESRGRWYLVASELEKEKIKTFGLDRIIDFDITKKHFSVPDNFNVNDSFQYCFGVINVDENEPEEVILSFDPGQGKFIKSYPLHSSQTFLIDNDEEFRIKLLLQLTDDLIMEILSYAERVRVIAPDNLVQIVLEHHREALKQYGYSA